MKNKIFLILIMLLVISKIEAQVDIDEDVFRSKNSVYFELLGSAGYLYNISYDRIILSKQRNNITAGMGIQYSPEFDLSRDMILSISPQINYMYGIKYHIEAGVGSFYDFYNKDFAIILRYGYRFQKPEGGMFYKIGFTPLITKSVPIFGENFTFIPWGGISIGWTFKE